MENKPTALTGEGNAPLLVLTHHLSPEGELLVPFGFGTHKRLKGKSR